MNQKKIKIKLNKLKYLKKDNIYLFNSGKPGKNIVILGGVHGNEIAGYKAIEKVITNLKINAGIVCLIIANKKAIDLNQRFYQTNLNRCFNIKENKRETYEENLAEEIKEIIKQFDICLDLHNSTNPKSEAFIICENNGFEYVNSINVENVVKNFDNLEPGGTDSYMNQIGKIGICVECGYLGNNNSVDFAKNTILNFLKYTNNLNEKTIEYKNKTYFNLFEVYVPKIDFKLENKLDDFEEIKKGQIIGKDGNEIIINTKISYSLFAKDLYQNDEEAFLLCEKIKLKNE